MISRDTHIGKTTVASATETGRGHSALLMPNQDAVSYICDENALVLAVADGVGSCAMGSAGAQAAVNGCMEIFRRIKALQFPYDSGRIVRELIQYWRAEIPCNQENEYCTTLKAVFKIGATLKAVSIGDGFLVITSEGRAVQSPDENSAFSNETRCFCKDVAEEDFWTCEFEVQKQAPYVVICCTDGVANGLVAGSELSIAEEIERNIAPADLKMELEELISDISQYCLDDKTIGVVKHER